MGGEEKTVVKKTTSDRTPTSPSVARIYNLFECKGIKMDALMCTVSPPLPKYPSSEIAFHLFAIPLNPPPNRRPCAP